MESKKWTLNGTDLWKTVRGGLIILAAAAITGGITTVANSYETWNYLLCTQIVPCIDLRFIMVPAISSLIELTRRWVAGWN